MNLVSGHVMGAAALITAPTLWRGFVTGAVPMEVAVTRFLIVAVIAWVALSAVEGLISATAAPRRAPDDQLAAPPDDGVTAT